jgi:hypothetical protein
MVIELEFDGEDIGFGDCDGMNDLELMKFLAEEEGLFGIIDVSNEDVANGIKSVEPIKE